MGRSTDDLMRLYALEGLLARLAVSRHAAQLVLKGGVLLAAYGTRRATRDIDLQARQVTNELGNVLTVIQEIAGITIDDGLTYAPEAATAQAIRQEDAYQGVRVALPCLLARARIGLHVDVNVGDPAFADPALTQEAVHATWDPLNRSWIADHPTESKTRGDRPGVAATK